MAGHSHSCITIFDISRRCREELERKRAEERARQQAEAQRLIEEKRRREEEEQRRAEEERAQAMREAALLQKQVGNANVTQMYHVSCYMYRTFYKYFKKYIIYTIIHLYYSQQLFLFARLVSNIERGGTSQRERENRAAQERARTAGPERGGSSPSKKKGNQFENCDENVN